MKVENLIKSRIEAYISKYEKITELVILNENLYNLLKEDHVKISVKNNIIGINYKSTPVGNETFFEVY